MVIYCVTVCGVFYWFVKLSHNLINYLLSSMDFVLYIGYKLPHDSWWVFSTIFLVLFRLYMWLSLALCVLLLRVFKYALCFSFIIFSFRLSRFLGPSFFWTFYFFRLLHLQPLWCVCSYCSILGWSCPLLCTSVSFVKIAVGRGILYWVLAKNILYKLLLLILFWSLFVVFIWPVRWF